MISMARDLKSENRKFEIAFLVANLVLWIILTLEAKKLLGVLLVIGKD